MEFSFKEAPDTEVTIKDDNNLSFKSPMVHFIKKVELINCKIVSLDIFSNYFADGLLIKDCVFECKVNWQSGGHNLKPVIFENCEFKEFVDFEDCCFDSDFIIRNVTFHKNSNLLGNKNSPVEVVFEIHPYFENVKGNLHINTFQH